MSKSFLRAVITRAQDAAAAAPPPANHGESSKEETSAVAKYTDKFMQLQKVCHFAMPCDMICDMSCHMT